MVIVGGASALKDGSWMVGNYGPRCTLVCAASALKLLGASSHRLVEVIEKHVRFHPSGPTWLQGPSPFDYVGLLGPSALDRGIMAAAEAGGISVTARTVMPPFWSWKKITRHIDAGGVVVLNCVRAPSGLASHSVVGIGYDTTPDDRLLTVDPNDLAARWKVRGKRKTGWIFCVTFISRR